MIEAIRIIGISTICELIFVRTTGDPQAPLSILITLLGYTLMTLPLLLLSHRFAPKKVQPYTNGIFAALSPLFVTLATPLMDVSKKVPSLTILGPILGSLLLAGIFLSAHKRRTLPSWIWVTIVSITLGIPLIVQLNRITSPIWGIVLIVQLIGLAFAVRHRLSFIAYAAAIALFAMAPLRPFLKEAKWRNRRDAGVGPDIVLLVVDTLRADAAKNMAVYKRLAKQGAAHKETQSAAPWTLPAMASLFTGKPAHVHGAVKDQDRRLMKIHRSLPTLPQRLSKLGYDCAAVISNNPNLSPRYGFKRGFSVYDQVGSHGRTHKRPGPQDYITKPALVRLLIAHSDRFTRPGLWHLLSGLPLYPDADYLVDRALHFAQARRDDRPLFMFLHFMEPHFPYRHSFETDLPFQMKRQLNHTSFRVLRKEAVWHTQEAVSQMKSAYQHEVDVVDRALMRFLDRLGPPGKRGRVVVLTADHGEEFYEHGGFEHGHAFYQELLHIPLVISGLPKSNPLGNPKARDVVGIVDIADALVQAAGGETAPAQPDGYVSENRLYSPPPNYSDDRNASDWAYRQGHLKVIEAEGKTTLFNLGTDPGEHHAVPTIDPQTRHIIERVRPGKQKASGSQVQLSEEEKEALRQLGYISE